MRKPPLANFVGYFNTTQTFLASQTLHGNSAHILGIGPGPPKSIADLVQESHRKVRPGQV